MSLIILSIYCIFLKKKLFLQENNKDIFVKMGSDNNQGLNFQYWLSNYPFNQISLNFICYFKNYVISR